MVLFHPVIEVMPDLLPAVVVQGTFGLEPLNGRRVGAVAVGVDHPGFGVILPVQGLGQKPLGGPRVLRGRQEKTEGRAAGIHGPVTGNAIRPLHERRFRLPARSHPLR